LVTHRRYGVPAGIKLFPIGLAIAVVSVLLSRVEGFQPGVIYGFVAAYAVLAPATFDRRQTASIVFYPAIVMITICALAWLLVSPFRDLAQDNHNWYAAIPEGAAVAIFVGGLEGLFFNLIPVRFMDGYKVWVWSKWAWLAMAGLVTFLFWHVLLNKEQDSFGALQQTAAASAFVLVGICLVLSIGTWLYFRLANGGERQEPSVA
jgi:hypothetical protein